MISITNKFLAIKKERGCTSNKVVQQVKKLLSDKSIKIGHTGTLDPLAEGVLILAIGEATKFSSFVINKDKKYHVKISFGKETDTNDSEGKIIAEKINDELLMLEKNELISVLQSTIKRNLLGKINQLPPRYSAVKVAGKKLYQYARKNEDVDVQKRMVEIFSFDVNVKSTLEKSSFFIHCSKGTYVRSLARDLGYLLNTYGHVTYLNRTEVGKVNVRDSITIDKLRLEIIKDNSSNIDKALFTVSELLPESLQKINVDSTIMNRLIHGQRINREEISDCVSGIINHDTIAIFHGDIFIGICSLDYELLRPKRMLKKEFIKLN